MTEQDRMQLQALRIQLVAAVAQIDCMMGTPDGSQAGSEVEDGDEFYPTDKPVGSATHS